MKKLIYLSLFLSFSNVSNAQVQDTAPWCPDGATWVYMQFAFGYANIYEYIGDTLIDGFSTKKIRDRQIQVYFPNPLDSNQYRIPRGTNYLFLRESNDSIFIFSEGQFKFMYKFSAGIGDQFILNNFVNYRTCAADSPNFVDDTLTLTETNTNYTVGDLIFRKSYFLSSGRWGFSSLIDKIGPPDDNLYPVPTMSDCYSQLGYNGLFCYTDNIRGTLFFEDTTNQRVSCEYLISTTLGLEDNLSLKPNPIVYPNPGVDLINIDINVSFADIEILDLNGRLVLSLNNTSLKGIDISSLSSGSYVIKVISNSNIYPIKFIKK